MAQVSIEYRGDMLLRATAGNHMLYVDLPATVGGKDRGMTPTELFAASLGACMAAVVSVFCRNSNIDNAGMTVEVTYDKREKPKCLSATSHKPCQAL